jgi:hypothetical protein
MRGLQALITPTRSKTPRRLPVSCHEIHGGGTTFQVVPIRVCIGAETGHIRGHLDPLKIAHLARNCSIVRPYRAVDTYKGLSDRAGVEKEYNALHSSTVEYRGVHGPKASEYNEPTKMRDTCALHDRTTSKSSIP